LAVDFQPEFLADLPKPAPDGVEISLTEDDVVPKPVSAEFQPDFPEPNSAEGGGGEFEFSFDDFAADGNGGADGFVFSFGGFPEESGAAFTFDANDEGTSETEMLFEKFMGLIANPCFEYSGRPLVELFRHEDPGDSAEAAMRLLGGNSEQ
jgi:hypothetical protein